MIRVVFQIDEKNLLVKKDGKKEFVVSWIYDPHVYQSIVHKNEYFEISPKKTSFDLEHSKDYPNDEY